ncbi:AraC family transcriptional regulator [Aliikangiella marina]|uniref:AraC family transcriptional regulator n=1 Tax=Aliikangiella marina TaxID=1712262 RepID=A0A545T4M0_9GAMM|nr:helix-turn-helix domain-containing protein [Aliikangiella marina]TQV72118.1 AraC family transcriptional regulator [Aliikangiella marina]
MLNLITTLNIGFSLIISVILIICYVFFLESNNKKPASIISSILFLSGIAALQLEHLSYFQWEGQPLDTLYYRTLAFAIPPMFYFFSRFVLFPEYRFRPLSALHFLPVPFVFIVDREIAVPMAFLIGAGYCVWLTNLLYRLRTHRNRFEIEFFFFVAFSLFALGVLVVGFSATYIDDAYFYHFYANGIGLAYMLVTAALIIYPDLLNELTEAVKLSYMTSTLSKVDVDQSKAKLDELMQQANIYQNENLNLSTLAEATELTSHQLSELINTQFGVSFSQYLREVRIERAKYLLKNEPQSSILSISMETGFKSQSNFYAAFKEITGQSPGNYRKSFQN